MDEPSSLMATLQGALGPAGPVLLAGFLGLVLIALALPAMLKRREDPLDKLKRETSTRARSDQSKALRTSDYSDKLQRFAQFLEPAKAEEMSAARLKMMQAGYRGRNSVRSYHAAQFVLGLSLLVIGVLWVLLTTEGEMDTQELLLKGMLPGVLGYYTPVYWVQRRVQMRREEMINGFPDSLDMMLVCVEAGQSLDQSIIRVAKEIRAGYPALGEEFEIVAQEIKAGKERAQVMRDLGERSGVPDIASFVTTMVQSATFGTSIAEALRIYASEMRDKRVMRAEEKANVLPTKLTLGTMLFTVPPLMIILIGPSIYGIVTTLGSLR
ncbi:type II secretion system F family protein [Falsigemmobacter faecalis]|uniref:Type II secretion system F family protein n=1 Tax=Falsigemmobacter faecalis TaxID=2488730 RepID=A0A3P3DEY3_9RHOB|nr:type II secretion system F family protein [Falsigemmobacter faecalis]RRH72216.1 type II secretion system F family protein [Falsigemmobacter faecalis]